MMTTRSRIDSTDTSGDLVSQAEVFQFMVTRRTIASLPAEIQVTARNAVDALVNSEFEQRVNDVGVDKARKLAALVGFSMVAQGDALPWHSLDRLKDSDLRAKVVGRLTQSIEQVGDFSGCALIFAEAGARSVFVAGDDSLSVDEYLEKVAAIVAAAPTINLVLDAAFVEWTPRQAFERACREISLPIEAVGVAHARDARHHSMLQGRLGEAVAFLDPAGLPILPDELARQNARPRVVRHQADFQACFQALSSTRGPR